MNGDIRLPRQALNRLALAALTAAALAVLPAAASAAGAAPVKLGVLTDISGPFSSNFGNSSVAAAQLAASDFGGKVAGRPIEIIAGDHLNKPDTGATIAQRWFDEEGVDAIVDVPNSSVALAVQNVAKQRKKVVLYAGAVSEMLSRQDCSPYTSQWVYTNDALAGGAGKAILKQGGDSWFFISNDFTFGKSLVRITSNTVTQGGGKVLGVVTHPTAVADVSPLLLQAMQSNAKVIGLAEAGFDLQNLIKTAAQFQITKKQKLAALVLQLNDVDALGLNTAQGLLTTDSFYWDSDDATRAFAARFRAKTGKPPSSMQAAIYSAVTHYLQAVKATGGTDAAAVSTWMKANPVNDFYGHGAKIRADGILMHDMYLMQVKTPAESKGRWDYEKRVAVIPADEAFPPMSSACPLVSGK